MVPLFYLAVFFLAAAGFYLAFRRVAALSAPAFERAPAPAVKEVASAAPVDGSEMQRQLMQAGFHHPEALRFFVWSKIGLAVLGLIVALLAFRFLPQAADLPPLQKAGVMLAAMLPGYYAPTMWVDKRRKAWLGRIELALPDALDFLLICVEAGQTTDTAVLRVSEEMQPVHPDLAARFHALSEALSAGADRAQAWMRLAYDTSNDDLRQLATIILQSVNMGTPIAQTLRVFSADLRDRRIRKVEERANVLPTKMTLGTMMFTVPPLLILLLAPAIFRIAMAN